MQSLRSAGSLFERTPRCHATGDFVSALTGPDFDVNPGIHSFSRRLQAMHGDAYWDAGGAAGGPPWGGWLVGEDYASHRDDWAGAVNGTSGPPGGRAEGEGEGEGGSVYDDAWEDEAEQDVAAAGVVHAGGTGHGGALRELQLQRFKSKFSAQRQKARMETQRSAQRDAAQASSTTAQQLHWKTVRQEAAQQKIPEFGYARDRLYVERSREIRAAMQDNLRSAGWLGDFVPMQMHCPLMGRRVSWQAASEFAAVAWRCDGLGFAWECLHQGHPPAPAT